MPQREAVCWKALHQNREPALELLCENAAYPALREDERDPVYLSCRI